jgi:hypothetical protein
MKFTMRLQRDGRWIGGFDCRATELKTMLDTVVRDAAAMWNDAVIATRIDRRGGRKGQQFVVEGPR